MTVNKRGRRKAIYALQGSGHQQTYHYESPGVSFESDKILNDPIELAKLSSEVKVYFLKGDVK